MKKKITILAAVFVLFAVLGSWYNLTPGRYLAGDFWKLKDGAYTHFGNEIRQIAEDTYALRLADNELTVRLSHDGENHIAEFSDGWAVEMKGINLDFLVEVGNVLITGETEYILMDTEAENLRFGKVTEEICEPFYDENGNAVGENRYLQTETGETVGWQEIWYEQKRWSTPEQKTVQLYDGIRLTQEDFNHNLLVNEDGEYLLNAHDASMIQVSSSVWKDRASVATMLVRLSDGYSDRRGHIGVVFMYAFIYWLGAVQLLWPQQLAFFGHRWQYRNEPELSDEGLFMYQLGAVIVMIMGIATMFINYQ